MSCPAVAQCASTLLFPGVSIQTTLPFVGACWTFCAPQIVAWIWLIVLGWTCGPCEDFATAALAATEDVDGLRTQLLADTSFLASDALMGRNNDDFFDATSSQMARDYLIQELQTMGAVGILDLTSTDASAYVQSATVNPFVPVRNILGVLPGSDTAQMANEYIVLGAHYDHIRFCPETGTADNETVCNGATDNATGVAAVLAMGRILQSLQPRRSIVLALWDAEEDGKVGSRYFTDVDPIVPLESIVAYINLDIVGANMVPSLRSWSFAIAPETGGKQLEGALGRAIQGEGLTMPSLSVLLGQGRSDHASFVNQRVPSVFFTDSNGPCYHTSGDEVKVVDFGKLTQQTRIMTKLAYELAMTLDPPSFRTALFPATYSDVRALAEAATQIVASGDIDLLPSEEDRTGLRAGLARLNDVVGRGPLLFPLVFLEIAEVTVAIQSVVNSFPSIACDGFLAA